jgi:hypothetical protein
MKKAILALCFLAGMQAAIGQTARKMIERKSDCAPVTQRIMEQVFSVEKQLQLQNSPEELACLDYICSASYEFAAGQTILRAQKVLFNIEKYKHLRRVDQRITVFDEASGLDVILYSWNEVEAALIRIRTSYQLASCD